MLALDFLQRVAQHLQEILVGGDDGAVQVEFDDGLGLVDGGDLAAQFHQFVFWPSARALPVALVPCLAVDRGGAVVFAWRQSECSLISSVFCIGVLIVFVLSVDRFGLSVQFG